MFPYYYYDPYAYDSYGYDPYRQPTLPTPPGFGGQGQGQQGQFGQPPSGPPPSYVPQQQSTYAIDPGGIRGCLYRFTYIRLENGRRFWFYPVFVGRRSIAGYRWRPRQYRWQYFGIDLDEVSSFSCH
ncbi:transporter [Bacillus atrophaeus]|uniref:transporter n=1 Tax=Bacillus atrophaeus TaxID=1452 RepID=UPI002161DE49|nr:transporter [Bacillus atrophaeus]